MWVYYKTILSISNQCIDVLVKEKIYNLVIPGSATVDFLKDKFKTKNQELAKFFLNTILELLQKYRDGEKLVEGMDITFKIVSKKI